MDGTVQVRSLVWFATGVAATLLATVIVMQTLRADAAPGDEDATLVSIMPCRLDDSRQAGGTPLGPHEVRTFSAHGSNGECTIPTDAVALSMNVTSDRPTEPSFWTIWPGGEPRPTSSNLNPAPGTAPTPNAVVTRISSVGEFQVYNDAGAVDIIIDINGYYTRSSLVELASRVADLEKAQPFTVAAALGGGGPVGTTAASVKDVEVTAPVDGQVTVIGSGYFFDDTVGDWVSCGVMDNITEPTAGVAAIWESPSGGDFANFVAQRTFNLSAGQAKTFYLVCLNKTGGTTNVNSPKLTALFTPAPAP